jgi:hypothetical protein
VTLTAAAVLTPKGDLNARVLWTDLTTDDAREERARAYITRASAQATADGWPTAPDADRRQLVNYFAWSDRYNEILDTPADAAVAEEGSEGWSAEQLKQMGQRAQAALDAWLAALEAQRGSVPAEPLPPTVAVRTVARF